MTLKLAIRKLEGFRSRSCLRITYIIKTLPNVAEKDITALIVEVTIAVNFIQKVCITRIKPQACVNEFIYLCFASFYQTFSSLQRLGSG